MKKYRVKAHSKLRLDKFDPDDAGDYKQTEQGKEKAKAVTVKLISKLDGLQERLYQQGQALIS